MIEPWQVWSTNNMSWDGKARITASLFPVVVISSGLHLRSMVGRNALVSPVTRFERPITNRVLVKAPKALIDGGYHEDNWVITEQIQFISTSRFTGNHPLWTLSPDEIEECQRAFRFMVDF